MREDMKGWAKEIRKTLAIRVEDKGGGTRKARRAERQLYSTPTFKHYSS
jgi:hypothetical protein